MKSAQRRFGLEEQEGVRKIARRLNEDGILTRTGRPWTAGAVRTLLRNPAYTGLYRRLGVTVTRAHPALVTAGQHAEVLRRMEARRTAPATQERREYLLSLPATGSSASRLIHIASRT